MSGYSSSTTTSASSTTTSASGRINYLYNTTGINDNRSNTGLQPIPVLWPIAIDSCGTCKSLFGRFTNKGDCQVECLSFFNVITTKEAQDYSDSLSTDRHSWAATNPSNQAIANLIAKRHEETTGEYVHYEFRQNVFRKSEPTYYNFLRQILSGDNNTPHSTVAIVIWEVFDPTQRGERNEKLGGRRFAGHIFTVGLTENMDVSIYDTQQADTHYKGPHTGRDQISEYFKHYPETLYFDILVKIPYGGKKHKRSTKRRTKRTKMSKMSKMTKRTKKAKRTKKRRRI